MISEKTKQEVLEHRVDFMVDFILAMRKNDIPERMLNIFKVQNRDFLYEFCYRVETEPDKYVADYDRRVK